MQPVFDGHNDILLRLWLANNADGFITGRQDTHIDATKAQHGGLKGGFFAVFVPSSKESDDVLEVSPVEQQQAHSAVLEMMAMLAHLSTNYPQTIRQCTDYASVNNALKDDTIAAILHFEGAEAVHPDLSNLEEFYQAGLRSIGPVWSRPNAFGHGVPFTFPGTPDQGPGLSEAGGALIRECNALGIMIDVSHLNEAGFRDVALISTKPIIATHSNVHALSPSPRNLTDWQLGAIAESGGLVGVNFVSAFLRSDGKKTPETPIDIIIQHLDYMLERLGEDGVALGSDFDGAIIPSQIGNCAGLPVLIKAMEDANYGGALIKKICLGNWLAQIKTQIG